MCSRLGFPEGLCHAQNMFKYIKNVKDKFLAVDLKLKETDQRKMCEVPSRDNITVINYCKVYQLLLKFLDFPATIFKPKEFLLLNGRLLLISFVFFLSQPNLHACFGVMMGIGAMLMCT
jgi:hypothetical protein